jgi:hypothetical protein
MSHQDSMFEAMHELKRHASKEQDPDGLGELVEQINELLDIIEKRFAELEDRKAPCAAAFFVLWAFIGNA